MRSHIVFVLAVFLLRSAITADCFANSFHDGSAFDQGHGDTGYAPNDVVPTPTDGGIREEILEKYRPRYDKWKRELTSTPYGRELWERFANHRGFILRIVVARGVERGAWAGEYKGDRSGRLVGATITLGYELDEGYPSAVHYPVLNSLQLTPVEGEVLAAAKLAHELGHVSQAANASFRSIQLRERLATLYNQRAFSLGNRGQDAFLQYLADQMGGTPHQLSQRGEYASEVFTYRYVESRIGQTKYFCRAVRQVRQNLEDEAPEYGPAFEPYLMRSKCFGQRKISWS